MTDSKHTPGTWHVNVINQHRPAIYTTHDDYIVADCVSGHRTHDEEDANAAFIVEACNNYDTLLRQRDELFSIANNLLANLRAYYEERNPGQFDPVFAKELSALAAIAKEKP